MVALNGLLERIVVRMVLRHFTGVISQNQMVLKGPLEGLTHHVFDGDYFFTGG